MRKLIAAAAGLAVVALMWAPSGAQSAAAEITEVGWWSRQPGAQPRPDGGFEISRASGQDVSVAALRIGVHASLSRAVLVLQEADDSLNAEGAALRVCATSLAWTAGNPGPYAEAPPADCEAGRIDLSRHAPTSSWAGDIQPLLSEGTVAVAIMPSASTTLPVDPGFRLPFIAARLEADRASGTTSTAPPGLPPESGDGGGFEFSAPVFDVPAAPSLPAPSEPLPVMAEPEAAAPIQQPGVGPSLADTLPPDERTSRPWGRLLAFVPLSLLVGAAVAAGRHVLRERGLAGAS